MPYMKVNRGDQIAVYKRGANGRPEGKRLGLHDGPDAAERQLKVLRAAAAHERKAKSGFSDLDFKPTASMATFASKGLAYVDGKSIPINEHIRVLGEDIAARQPLSPRTVRQLGRVFSRCDQEKQGWNTPESPSEDWVLFLVHGGLPGVVWSKSLADQMDRVDEPSKTINISNAGEGGFGVDEDDVSGEGLANTKSRFSLDDEVYHPTMAQEGTVTGVIRQKSGSVIYHVAFKTGGMALCKGTSLGYIGTKGMKASDRGFNVALTQMKFIHAMVRNQRKVSGIAQNQIKKLLKRLERSKGDIPLRKRLSWKNIVRLAKKLERSLDKHWGGDEKDPRFVKLVLSDLDFLIRETTRLKHSPILAYDTDEEAETSTQAVSNPEPVEVADPAARKAVAIKSLTAAAAKYAESFSHAPPPVPMLNDAFEEIYALAEDALDIDDEHYKSCSSAIYDYDGVDEKAAAAWAQKIMDSMPQSED